jgi:hypothetical protein
MASTPPVGTVAGVRLAPEVEAVACSSDEVVIIAAAIATPWVADTLAAPARVAGAPSAGRSAAKAKTGLSSGAEADVAAATASPAPEFGTA